jgi:hypothetical protein
MVAVVVVQNHGSNCEVRAGEEPGQSSGVAAGGNFSIEAIGILNDVGQTCGLTETLRVPNIVE